MAPRGREFFLFFFLYFSLPLGVGRKQVKKSWELPRASFPGSVHVQLTQVAKGKKEKEEENRDAKESSLDSEHEELVALIYAHLQGGTRIQVQPSTIRLFFLYFYFTITTS